MTQIVRGVRRCFRGIWAGILGLVLGLLWAAPVWADEPAAVDAPTSSVTNNAPPKTQEKLPKSSRFRRPMITYLGMGGDSVRRLPRKMIPDFENSLRNEIEKGRFIYVKVPMDSGQLSGFVEKMVRIVSKKSMGVAKLRAEWDTQFQGFSITSEMLNAIQNQSYVYWVELSAVEKQRASASLSWIPFMKTIFGKNAKQYRLSGTLYVRRLKIFDCTQRNRALGPRFARACQGKQSSEYAGFAERARATSADTGTRALPSQSSEEALLNAASELGKRLLRGLAQYPEFRLHSPIARSTLTTNKIYLGKREGLKLNQGLKVFVRHVRGHLLYKGFMRVRAIGDNRIKIEGNKRSRVNPNAPLWSDAQSLIVKGDYRHRKGMLVFEYPQPGLSLGVYLGMSTLLNDNFVAKGGAKPEIPAFGVSVLDNAILAPSFQLDFQVDISHSVGLNEFYFNVMLEAILPDLEDLPLLGYVGVIKRFYFRQLAFDLGIRAGGGAVIGKRISYVLGAEAMTGLEFFVSPHLSVALRAAFRFSLPFRGDYNPTGPWATLGVYYSF